MSFTRTLRAVGGAVVAGALLFGTAPVASADKIRDDQWPLEAFDADAVWKESTGKGVKVAVLDNGVDGTHPDLEGNVLPGKKLLGGRADQESVDDHGTGMASIIAGHGHGASGADGVKGLAPDAKILPVDMMKEDGGEELVRGALAEALTYAVDAGATVINVSFNTFALSADDKAAISYALKKDVVLVAGAGNENSNRLGTPADAPGFVSVGAVGKDLEDWEDSNSNPKLTLTAPGEYIRSAAATTPYQLTSGTSDSTAYVSGAAAVLRAKFPDLTAGQIINRLVKTAVLPDSKKHLKLPDADYGYGIIRPYSALTKDIPAGPRNGPLEMPKDVAAGSNGADGTDASGSNQAEEEKGLATAAIVGIAAGVLVLIALLIVVIVRKNRRNGPPPGVPGGFGPSAPGFPPQQPGGYPQQPGAYPQQAGPPGAYPSAPPTQPPGQY
ncbi:S8 family serine peptidase [Streptomyces sp. NPDC004647]|uniref:S8 family serine peptidase n=1 Tax=Streptomyces sp. NPDC004647 TaxID=3154671 RepID=UPI0033B0380F